MCLQLFIENNEIKYFLLSKWYTSLEMKNCISLLNSAWPISNILASASENYL